MTITALSRALVADRSHPRWRERLGSVGIAQSCVEVRVGDEDGHQLPAGETGEILVRGAPVMLGYWRNPEATAQTIREGWLWTGDVGSMDDDGFLMLKDRSKDVIISGGSNIYPREVEEALLLHPAVLGGVGGGAAEQRMGRGCSGLRRRQAAAPSSIRPNLIATASSTSPASSGRSPTSS